MKFSCILFLKAFKACFLIIGVLVLSFLVYVASFFPRSYEYEKSFILLSSIYCLIFSILYVLLKLKAAKVEKTQNAQPSTKYLGARLIAARYMDRQMESGDSWMEQVTYLVRMSIFNNLDGNQEEEAKLLRKVRQNMEILKKDLFCEAKTPADRAKNEMIKKAVSFYIKSQMMKNPVDLQGRRRCYVLLQIFSEIIDLPSCMASVKEACPCPSCRTCCRLSFPKKYSCVGKGRNGKPILTTVAFLMLFTVVPFLADIFSDFNILVIYWGLWSSSGNTSLIYMMTGNFSIKKFEDSMHYMDPNLGSEIIVPLVYLSCIFGFSMFLTILSNPFKKISRNLKTALKMGNPLVEKNCEILSPSSVIQRDNLSIDESGLESPYQCAFQFGTFLSLVPIIHVLQTIDPNNPVVTAYDENLTFLYSFFISAVTSTFNLTMGQVKRNSVFHEHNLSWQQNILYVLACLFATMSFLFVVIMLVASLISLSIIYNSQLGFNALHVFSGISVVYIFLSYHSKTRIGQLILKACKLKTNKSELSASSSSYLTSTLSQLFLVTSQYITWGNYNIYHNTLSNSPKLIRGMASQYVCYLIYLVTTLIFNCLSLNYWSRLTLDKRHLLKMLNLTVPGNNTDSAFDLTNTYTLENYEEEFANKINSTLLSLYSSVIDIPRYEASNRTHLYVLPKSLLGNATKNFTIGTLVIVPISLILSYAFLVAYFKFDKGFFSMVNIDYWFEQDKADKKALQEEDVDQGEDIPLIVVLAPANEESPEYYPQEASTAGHIVEGGFTEERYRSQTETKSNAGQPTVKKLSDETEEENTEGEKMSSFGIASNIVEEMLQSIFNSQSQNTVDEIEESIYNDTKNENFWDAWIDRDVEEDWYAWRNISSKMFGTKKEPIQEKFDMTGIWIDLTGDEGCEDNEDCEDGSRVLRGEEGSLEHKIKMSFPYYRLKTKQIDDSDSNSLNGVVSEEVCRSILLTPWRSYSDRK